MKFKAGDTIKYKNSESKYRWLIINVRDVYQVLKLNPNIEEYKSNLTEVVFFDYLEKNYEVVK